MPSNPNPNPNPDPNANANPNPNPNTNPHPHPHPNQAWKLACGEDDAPVAERPLAKQVGSSKNFGGRRGAARGPLDTRAALEGWVQVGE